MCWTESLCIYLHWRIFVVNFNSDNCMFVRTWQWSFQKMGISRFPSVDGSLTISILLNLLNLYQKFSQTSINIDWEYSKKKSHNKIFLNLTPLFYGNIKSSDGIKHRHVFILAIKQLDAQNFFTISLFHASTCFEHICSSSGGQNCIIQPLVSPHL